MSRGTLIALSLVALPVLGLAACNALVTRMDASHAETVRTMHREARALVPARARVVYEQESACVELRSYPSCIIVSFDLAGTHGSRQQAIQKRLRARGWTPVPSRPSFVYERGDLYASVRVLRHGPVWEERCADRNAPDDCLDSVLVRVR